MATKLDAQTLGKYAALGAGAVAAPVLLSKAAILAPVLDNQLMNAGWMGITVGAVVVAGLGVGVVDYLVYNR